MTYDSEILADSPRYHFRFDGTGTLAVDQGTSSVTGVTELGTITKGNTGLSTVRAGDKTWNFSANTNALYGSISGGTLGKTFSIEALFKFAGGTAITRQLANFTNNGTDSQGYFQLSGGTNLDMSIYSGFYSHTLASPTGWNHIVYTSEASGGSNVIHKAYVNGTLVYTSSAFAQPGSNLIGPHFEFGEVSGTPRGWLGDITEFAVFPTTLSQARVTAHYDAATTVSIPGGYTATPMTASSTFPAPTLPNTSYVATAMTSTGLMVDPSVTVQRSVSYSTTAITASGSAPNATATGYAHVKKTASAAYKTRSFNSASGGQQWYDGTTGIADYARLSDDDPNLATNTIPVNKLSTVLPSVPGNATNVVAKIGITNLGTTGNYSIRFVSVDTDFSTANGNATPSLPANGAVSISAVTKSITGSFAAPTYWDITSIYNAIAAGTAYGYIAYVDDADPNDAYVVTPRAYAIGLSNFTVEYDVPTSTGSITVTPLTASGSMPTPTVLGTTGTSYAATPMVASNALMVDPNVDATDTVSYSATPMTAIATMPEATTPDRNVTAVPMEGSALMPNGVPTGGTGNSTNATPMTASGLMNEASASNITTANYTANAMLANALMRANTEAANPRNHPYYLAVKSQIDSDDIWIPFFDKSGTKVTEEVSVLFDLGTFARNGATYNGGMALDQNGPAERQAANFDGIDDYMIIGQTNDSDGQGTYSVELVFRTSRANQILTSGRDTSPLGSIERVTSIQMRDGKISLVIPPRFGPVGQPIAEQEILRGFKNVDDGQWHHVVISTWWYDVNTDVDYNHSEARGQLAIWIDGKLDRRNSSVNTNYVMARPDIVGKGVNEIGNYFQGDMSMLVGRRGYGIPKYLIEQNYYVALAINPIRTGPITAIASMPNAKGKGNAIRVLYLNHINTFYPTQGYNIDRVIYWKDTLNGNFMGRIVEERATWTNPNNPGGYRNPVTDERRLIDLRTDVDVTDFDMIYIPRGANDLADYLSGALNITKSRALQAIDTFYDSVRWAVAEKGLSMYITDPDVAKEIGFINNYVGHDINFEVDNSIEARKFRPGQGQLGSNYTNQYDYWGWKDNPWPTGNPYQYNDTHMLTGERIVATEPGLTDFAGYTLSEAFSYVGPDPFSRNASHFGFRYDANPNGLTLNKELLFQTRNYIDPTPAEIASQTYSVPPANVVVGTIIAKEITNDWVREGRPANPYADYATTIIIKEGDSINGVENTGRVFMSFNSSWTSPDLIQMGLVNQLEEPEKQAWQISSFRSGGNYIVINDQGRVVEVTPPAGQPSPGEAEVPPKKAGAIYVWQPDQIATTPVDNGDMGYRGYRWLVIDKLPISDDDAVISAPIMTANAQMVTPTSSRTQTINITTGPMLGNGKMVDRDNGVEKEVEFHVYPATASASMPNYVILIRVEPMAANAVMVTNFDQAFDRGAAVDVVFARTDNKQITVYLRSE